MKTKIFLSALFLAFNANASYENYDNIVKDLSAQRDMKVASQVATSVPHQRFHLSLGYVNSSTKIDYTGMGNISQSGLLLGGAYPLLSNQLFFEAFGKFFQDTTENSVNAKMQQYEIRVAHKEPLSFAILNVGVGTSVRRMSFSGPLGGDDMMIPGLLIGAGLERRISSRVSVAGDLGYHRSLKEENNGKDLVELVLRLNYHL